MDNKRLIIGMTTAMLLILVWYRVMAYVDQKHPEWAQALAATQPTTQPAAPVIAPPATSSSTGPSISPAMGLHAVSVEENKAAVVLGSDREKDEHYAMQVILSQRGAGIQKITLNQFRQSVRTPGLYSFQEPYEDHPESTPLATRTLVVDGAPVDTDGNWKLEANDASSARFTQEIALDTRPVLRLSKTYRLPDRQSSAKEGQGYELQVDYTIQNLADHALTITSDFNGPTIPPREVERGADRQVLVGYREGAAIRVAQHLVEEFHKDKASQDLSKSSDGSAAAWAGAASVYFNALVLPDDLAKGATKSDYTIVSANLDPGAEPPSNVAMTFHSGSIKLAPEETASLPLNVFFGPKQRALLDSPYYASFPRQYNNTLVITSGFCGVCTLPWLINVLVAMLSAFHYVFRDWGISIICLVVIVRVLLHPITKKSQVHMMKMGKMGPEMERLKKKYGDNKDELNKAMMQFYKEQGLAPVLGCLPMFLQMPIWIALWNALQSTFELRHSPFLFFGPVHLTWIKDLANPDALISWPPIHIYSFDISSLNILPIFLSVVFFFQQKYTPKPITTTPEQAQQQKMMTWMSTLLFPFFLYKGPAGLNLYILTSTTIGIIESKVIRDHIKQREEAEKAGRVFIPSKPTRGARRRDERDEPPPKKSGVMGWLADLQERAEQIRTEAEKKKG